MPSVGAFAMACARHMHQYGTRQAHLAGAAGTHIRVRRKPDAAARNVLTLENKASPRVRAPSTQGATPIAVAP